MNILSKIAVGAASFALVALLSMPIAGAAGGAGTGPAPGTGEQMMNPNGPGGTPCYGKGHGRRCGKCCKCNGAGTGQGHGGFVDKDGDGICDHNPNSGKGGAPAK